MILYDPPLDRPGVELGQLSFYRNVPLRREEMGLWLTANGLKGVGVEIGVAEGAFSAHILNQWPGLLIGIDPWRQQSSDVYLDSRNSPHLPGAWLDASRAVAAAFPARFLMIRALSGDVAPLIEQPLDWVYIDGNHSYEACRKDIEVWWPKLKSGGLLGGHDYYNKSEDGWNCGVLSAVNEWSERENQDIVATSCCSWWTRKQKT